MKRFTSFMGEANNTTATGRSDIMVPTLSEKDLRENYFGLSFGLFGAL